MKNAILKLSLALLIFTICWQFAPSQTVQTPSVPFIDNGKNIIFKGKVAGDWRQWLTVEAHNGREWEENGFDPCYTRVVVDYRPLVRKLPTGQYELIFVSEIAKGLP